jgi:hypothetical protein
VISLARMADVVDAAVDVIRGRPMWRHVAQFQRLRLNLRADDL